MNSDRTSRIHFIHSFFHSFHWHVQNATIPCRSQELLPFLSVIYFFLPLFSTTYSSILPPFILPSISWSTKVLLIINYSTLHPPKLCSCSASWWWASDARNMSRLWVLIKWKWLWIVSSWCVLLNYVSAALIEPSSGWPLKSVIHN
jgi:hypothetical protein